MRDQCIVKVTFGLGCVTWFIVRVGFCAWRWGGCHVINALARLFPAVGVSRDARVCAEGVIFGAGSGGLGWLSVRITCCASFCVLTWSVHCQGCFRSGCCHVVCSGSQLMRVVVLRVSSSAQGQVVWDGW